MRITALSVAFLLLTIPASAAPADAGTPYVQIAKLASSLSDGEPIGALEIFDKAMPHHAAIAERMQALATQADVLCSIDVVADKESDDAMTDVHHLDLDWYMTLKSKADSALLEKRRLRVAVTMRRIKGNWRITEMVPEEILDPIRIR